MADDLPFSTEYAKSGRAACKSCKSKIDKDELRMATMVQSPMFDGKIPNWHHFRCFFAKFKVRSEGDIANFESLRFEDQKKIKEKIASGVGNSEPTTSKSSKAQKRKSGGSGTELNEFSVEYAKSNRSSCKGCKEKVEKGVIRISKLDRESDTARRFGPSPGWYHWECFVQARQQLEYFDAAENLPGFMTLGVEDQKKLKESIKKIKQEPKDETDSKKPKIDPKEEKTLQEQSKKIFKNRDWLKNNLKKKDWIELLEHNEQGVPSGESALLERLSDIMTFGTLQPCKECGGQLVFSSEGYRCTGDVTEWTKCQYVTETPKRTEFIIPHEFKEEFSFLNNYKYKKADRLLPTVKAAPSSQANSGITTVRMKKPLDLTKIALGTKTETPKEELKRKIIDLGGRVVSVIDESVACLISTEVDVKKMTKKIREAQESNIHVVAETFLDEVQFGNVAEMIVKHSIGSWGSSPEKRLGACAVDGLKLPEKSASSKFSRSGKSMKQKVTVKGGAAVDPDCEIGDIAHVLMDGKSPYNVVLGKVDLIKGTNSFYKLQALESDSGNQYWVFRSWGRVGTTIGGTKLDKQDSKFEAVSFFKAQYEEKTQNVWENRDNFEKKPRAFYPLDIDYGAESNEELVKKLQPGKNSKLHKSVQELICLIFDIEKMKKALVEFEVDLEKMPLGKLSKKQIEKAYSVLKELEDIIKSGKDAIKLLDASTRFYTLIPHDFGLEKPPLLDSENVIKLKIEMLDSLLEIEVAYSLLKDTSGGDSGADPVDLHYKQLHTKLEVLDKESDEFELLKKYIANTHASTHNMYELDIEEVYKVDREGEPKRYKPFKKLHNRQLLWHGSRTTNYAGILTNGLKIAPPEAPVTGYMFGKGIYFADMVSKSANYCFTSKSNPTGLLLLCEVALGDMYELTNADHITKLPNGKHSTKGLGRTHPDPKECVTTPDGVVVPLGTGVKGPVSQTSLLYNEYIVYDTAQVNIKYLLKVNFKYRY